jgi:O-antigen/teichoic acid export membrane protein
MTKDGFLRTQMPTIISETPAGAAPPKRKSRVLRNVISNWGAYFVSMAVNFVLSPYVVGHLGTVGYGVWTLILSLTGYLGLLDLGVRGAVTRYVAKFHSEAAHKRSSEVASSAAVIFGTAGMIAILVSFVCAYGVIGHMHIPPDYMGAARAVLVLTGLSVATSLINGVFGGILVGLQRFDLTNGIEVSISLLRSGAIVLALHFGCGIVTLACLQLAFTVARWATNIVLTRHYYPELHIRFASADRAGIKLIFSFSAYSFLMHVSASLIYASDNVVIGAYLPVTFVTFYVIGGNLVEYARTLVTGISQALTPLASSTETRGDPAELQKLVLTSSRWASMVILPVTCTFLLRGRSFIGLWMGWNFADVSGHVLSVLSITLMFWGANCAIAGIFLGLSKHKPIVPALIFEGICNLTLSIFLVKRLGIIGVAWGTAVPSLITNLIFWPWYIRRTLKIQPYTYAISAWIRPWGSLVLFFGGTYLTERYWPAPNLFVFFSQVGLVLPLAFIGYWFICLNRTQRKEYFGKLSNTISRTQAVAKN